MNIKKLRQKYGVSQDELAKRLGISRFTLIKIEQGKRALTIPEKQKLEEVFESLGEGFNESKRLSDIRINIPQKNIKKFKEVLLYILQKVGAKPNIGMTVIYKLLYFIDFDYYEKYEKQLMGLTYIKNHHGPTPREFIKVIKEMKKRGDVEEIKSKYYQFEQRKFLPLREPNLDVLKPSELQVIDSVLARLSDMSAKEISDYVHGDIPFQTTDDKENIDYEYALYREKPYSVREYDKL